MKIIKPIVILLMLFSFLVVSLTGIVRIPEIQRYFSFIYNFINASQLAFLHDWSGFVLVITIVTHLIIKRKWLYSFLDLKHKISPKLFKIVGLIFIALIFAYFSYYFIIRRSTHQSINLSGVEIKDYNGEKLGSITDFRENSIKGVQNIDKGSYRLEVGGLVNKSASYNYDDLLKKTVYQKIVTLDCVEGWSVKALWKGLLVRDLIADLDIKPEAKSIIFYAQDGYSTSFPIDYVLNNDIILAYNLNGVELPPERGFPLQLVAEQKWGYKWIKWITKIEISDDINYKGYWEQRGYNNNGDLNGSKFQ